MTMTLPTKSELAAIFANARENCEWANDPTSDPDCRSFYRYYYAAQETLRALGHEATSPASALGNAIHESHFFIESSIRDSVTFSDFVRAMTLHAARFPEALEKPSRSAIYSHEANKPIPDFEVDARNIFEAQFKAHYKGQRKRLDSDFGRSEWARVRDGALAMAKERFKAKFSIWAQRDHDLREKHADLMSDWSYNQVRLDAFRKAVAELSAIA